MSSPVSPSQSIVKTMLEHPWACLMIAGGISLIVDSAKSRAIKIVYPNTKEIENLTERVLLLETKVNSSNYPNQQTFKDLGNRIIRLENRLPEPSPRTDLPGMRVQDE